MDSLRQHRLKKGWTQEQLAKYSDVSRKTIQRIESGRSTPSRDVAKSLAAALEVPPSTLREGAGAAALVRRYINVAHRRRLTDSELARLPPRAAQALREFSEARASFAQTLGEVTDARANLAQHTDDLAEFVDRPVMLALRDVTQHFVRASSTNGEAWLRYVCAYHQVQKLIIAFQ